MVDFVGAFMTVVDCKEIALELNQKISLVCTQLSHWTAPFIGRRFALIFYNRADSFQIPADDPVKMMLNKLGFKSFLDLQDYEEFLAKIGCGIMVHFGSRACLSEIGRNVRREAC